MLAGLVPSPAAVRSGLVNGLLPGGQYRVTFNGLPAVAVSQAGIVPVGAQVTIAETDAGLVIVAIGRQAASTITEVTISG